MLDNDEEIYVLEAGSRHCRHQRRGYCVNCETLFAGVKQKKRVLLGLMTVILAASALADNWPGLNGGGMAANSSPTAIGTNLGVRWSVRLDPLTRNSRLSTDYGFTGSMRSKNIVLRDGEIALLAPDAASTDLAIYDAALGGIRRAFPTALTKTGNAEWNDAGIEGRDLRNGQHLVYWHANGNVYCRSHGDNMQRAVIRASDGTIRPNVGPTGSNQSGYFIMADNSIWNISSIGGHQGQQRYFVLHDNGGVLGTKQFGAASGATYNLFTWCGPVLMDGDWIYTLGAATHPDLGWADYTTSSTRCNWLGTFIRGFKVLGQTATTNNQGLVNGINGSFTWKTTNSFVATDHDLASAVKPWCLGRSNIFVVTESASWTTNDANVDFTQPMVLTALDRTNGAVAFTLPLGITGEGCWMYKSFGYYGGGTTWRPQVAYADRASTDGREYVSVLLPEAVETFDSLAPSINPTNSATNLNTRIAMVDVAARTELWTYEYPRGGTTPVLAQCVNTTTKQIIAGDSLYVAYVKTATNLDNYISTNILSALTLYVDRFALSNGARTSFQFPLGLQANTMQLDDLAAANGLLYALVTYREWHISSPHSGGGQALVALGSLTPGNQAPVLTAGPSASSTNITAPVFSVTLNAAATDPDGPQPAIVWSCEAGGVDFSTNSSVAATTTVAAFSAPGTYVIGCRATDGELSVTSNVTVTVSPPLTTVTASVPDNSAAEAGLATGYFFISRSGGDSNSPMTVYCTIGGTASNGVDYALLPTGSLTLPAGVTSTNLVVKPIDDLIVEPTETVTLKLASDPAYNYKLGTTSTFTLNLTSDDQATYEVTLRVPMDSIEEQSGGSVEVVRNGTINPLVVNYTVAGTASSGVDYTPLLSGSVTIADGASYGSIDFDAILDDVVESNETVVVTLLSGTNYTVGVPDTASVTIVDATPVRMVWERDQPDAPWNQNYWTDTAGQDNFQDVPRACDEAWVGEATIDTRSSGLNMADVTVAGLDVGWRLDAGNADNGNLRILGDAPGFLQYNVSVNGDLRLANGTNCSGAITQQGGSIVLNDLRLACGEGYGPWSYRVQDGKILVWGNLLMGDLGVDGTNFDNASASPGFFVQTGTSSRVDCYGDYRVNSGAAGAPARGHIVAANSELVVQGSHHMQIGGGFTFTSDGLVTINKNLELGKSAARSNTVFNIRGGTFNIGQLLDMDEPGEAQLNISGGKVTAGSLAIRSGTMNRISISQLGVLWVSQISYSVAAAEADIAAGRIVAQRPLAVSTTNNGLYVVIAQAPASVVSVTATTAQASENPPASGVFTIQREGITSGAVVVNYSLGGTATLDSDYTLAPTGSVTLAAGVTSTNIVVTPVDDPDSEDDETVTLTLLPDALYDLGAPSAATVVIGSDDGGVGAVTVTASDASAAENPAEPGEFTITRTNTTGAIDVKFAMSGTATLGSDYTGPTGSVRIADGQASATVAVTPVDDALIESSETVILTLLTGSRYTLGDASTGVVTLVSDDVPTVTLAATGEAAVEATGTAGQFTFTRSGITPGLTNGDLTVSYAVSGTASNGTDYTMLPGSLVISNGQATATLLVSPLVDGLSESTETVVLSLSTDSAYVTGTPSNGTVTIWDITPPYYAVTNGPFNVSSTWGVTNGYPSAAGDVGFIAGWTVTATNIGEVGAGVTVNLSGNGVLQLPAYASGTTKTNVVHSNAVVNVNAGGLLWVGARNSCNHSNTLNGGTLALPPRGYAFNGVLTVAADSVISNSSVANGIELKSRAHGSGKLTVMYARDTLGADNIAFVTGSTWTGNWDFADNVQERIGSTALSVPQSIRVGSGAAAAYSVATTIKGTLSGTGTNLVSTGATLTIGTSANQGIVSPGDSGPGTLTLSSYSSGNYGPVLAFASNSIYAVDIQNASSYDRVTVMGTGTGTGKVTIATGARLNLSLSTPTENVALDATIIDTARTNGANGLLTGSFSAVNWSNTNGWTGLVVTNIDSDLRVQGNYIAGSADANSNSIPDTWELGYFGSLTNSGTADKDGDGLDNYGEWVAGTDPTNGFSRLIFSNVVQTAGGGMVVRWSSASNRFYSLKLSTNLVFDPFTAVLTNRAPATPPVNVHTDAVSRFGGAFYRITVENQ